MTRLLHVADRVLNRPLLLHPDKAAVILGVLSGRIGVDAPEANRHDGDFVPERDDQGNVKRDAWGDPKLAPYKVSGSVGLVSVVGSLVNRGAYIGAYSGVTSYEGIQFQLKRCAADAQVQSILLDIHSPGGEAIGAFETAALIREIAKTKKVVAVVNGMAASAGYAIASGATDIVTTESGLSGSIGVLMMHVDYSKWLDTEGIKPTLIFAGAHKVDGNSFEPLTDDVKSDIQAEVDHFYSLFLNTVAAGRGSRLDAAAARKTEARCFIGEAAVKAGLADSVGTFETVLADLSRAPGRSPSQKGKSMSENPGTPAAEAKAGLTQADLDKAKSEAKAEAKAEFESSLKADRERIAALDELGAKAGAGAAAIITKAKSEGTSAEAAALAIFKAGAHLEGATLATLQADDKVATAATPAAPAGQAKASTPEGWKAEYEASPALKAEFPTAEAYVAFMKNEAKNGDVK